MSYRNLAENRIILGINGIDLNASHRDSLTAVAMLNCIYRNGAVSKVTGSTSVSSLPLAGQLALNRAVINNTVTLMVISTTTLRVYTTTLSLSLTISLPSVLVATDVFMSSWSVLNRAYITDNNSQPLEFDGTAVTALAAAPLGAFALLPYQSRLLSFKDSDIRWCGADYDTSAWTTDAQAIRATGDGSISAVGYHSFGSDEAGARAKVFVAKPSSCGLFSGFDFNPTSVDFNNRTRFEQLSESVGCVSPRTIVNTPIGTIFLSTDKRLYLLTYGGDELVNIGERLNGSEGLPFIESSKLKQACAVYHDGFYKLSIPLSTKVVQYWLDIANLRRAEEFSPFFGPMTERRILQFAYGADPSSLVGLDRDGILYQLNVSGVFGDYTVSYQSPFDDFSTDPQGNSDRFEDRDIHVLETSVESSNEQVTLGFFSLAGQIGADTTIQAIEVTGANLYGTFLYGVNKYATGVLPPVRRKIVHFEAGYIGRPISTMISYTGFNDFKLFYVFHKGRFRKHSLTRLVDVPALAGGGGGGGL